MSGSACQTRAGFTIGFPRRAAGASNQSGRWGVDARLSTAAAYALIGHCEGRASIMRRALLILLTVLATGSPALADVACVQRELARIGLDPGPADGQLGGKTLKAARAFQEGAPYLPDLTVDLSSRWCEVLKEQPSLTSAALEANVGVVTAPTLDVTPILGETAEYQVPAWVNNPHGRRSR